MISLQDSVAVYDVPPLKESICFSRRESLTLSPAVRRQLEN